MSWNNFHEWVGAYQVPFSHRLTVDAQGECGLVGQQKAEDHETLSYLQPGFVARGKYRYFLDSNHEIFRAQRAVATTVCSISQVTLSTFCFLLCFYTFYMPWSFTYSFILMCHLKCFWHFYCAILIGRKAPYFPNHWQTHRVEIVHLFK